MASLVILGPSAITASMGPLIHHHNITLSPHLVYYRKWRIHGSQSLRNATTTLPWLVDNAVNTFIMI